MQQKLKYIIASTLLVLFIVLLQIYWMANNRTLNYESLTLVCGSAIFGLGLIPFGVLNTFGYLQDIPKSHKGKIKLGDFSQSPIMFFIISSVIATIFTLILVIWIRVTGIFLDNFVGLLLINPMMIPLFVLLSIKESLSRTSKRKPQNEEKRKSHD